MLWRTLTAQEIPEGVERGLLATLKLSEKAFQRGNKQVGITLLNAYKHELWALRGKKLTDKQADLLAGQANLILSYQ